MRPTVSGKCIVFEPWNFSARRNGGAAFLALIAAAVLWPDSAALAQQCTATGTNQTCTNSIFLPSLHDTATLTVINTSTGTIAGSTTGLSAITAANVTNFGMISGLTNGIAANGTVVNYGSISGGIASGAGIVATSVTVTNYGGISGGFYGINASTANVTNFGTISSATRGINVSEGNVTNAGIISGVQFGIRSDFNANVTNSGTIVGGLAALSFIGSADTLTLLPGSKIVGAINLGTGDTVNFRTGNQNLTFNTLAGATVTSNVPFAVSGNQAVTIDPTPFAANGRMLGDFTRSASQVVPDFGNQPAATGSAPMGYAPPSPSSVGASAFDGIPGLQAYAADQAMFKAPTVVQPDGTAVWARGFGGYRTQSADGVLLRTSNTFYGGAIGFEKQMRSDLRLGAFAGGGTTRSTIEMNMGDTNSNLGFGGVYARYFRGASFLYAAVQGGGSRNDTTRNNINNNLVASGIETATGSYSGWYISPELRLGHNVALGQAFGSQYTLTPSIGVRYLYGSFGGYTETGSTANLTVNSQTVDTLEERAELKLTRATTFNATTALLLDITGGALGTQRVGSNTVNAALLGQSIPFAVSGKDDTWGGFGGAGMEWRTDNVSLFASGEYLRLSDSSTVISGKGGVSVRF